MNNNIIVTLKSSTTEMNLNSHEEGVYLIPDLEGLTSLPEIRTSSGVNAGADGGWTSAQFFDARSIALKVVISNEDVSIVEQKRQALNSLLAQGRKEDLLLTVVTEAGNAYTVYVRPTSVSSALNQVLKVQEMLIQFRADDPLIYGEGSAGGEEAILHVQQALGGFAIPFKFPLAIGGGSDATIITNNGSESVYPVITLEGPLHSPTVINRTTNQQIQVLVDLMSTIYWAGEETAQGNYIQVTNQLDIPAALKSAELLGDAEQTTYSGKNLLHWSQSGTTYTSNDITYTLQSDGTVKVNGTASANSTCYMGFNQPGAGRYLLSGCPDGGSGTTYMIEANYKQSSSSSNSYPKATGSTANGVINLDATGSIVGIYLSVRNGTTVNNLIFKPMLELTNDASSTVRTYEPYTNGPAPNPDYPQEVNVVTGEQTVNIAGKNLFDYASASDTANTIVTQYRVFAISGLAPNGRYTMSGQTVQQITDYTKYIYLWSASTYSGSERKVSLKSASTVTFDANADGEIYLAIYPTDTATWTSILSDHFTNAQLEFGNQASSFEPYQGRQALPVNLGKNLVWGKNIGSASGGLTSIWDATTGFVHITGQATTTWANISDNTYPDTPIPAGTYTFSTTPISNNIRKILRLYYADGTYNSFLIPKGSSSIAVNISKPSNRFYFYIDGFSANDNIDETFGVMLEKGSQATAYAPVLATKNLLNPYAMSAGYIGANGSTYAEANSKYTEFIPALPNTTYSLSIASGGSTPRLCIAEYEQADESTFIVRTNVQTNTASATTSANCRFIRCSINTTLATPNYQLELGSVTPYEPYGTPYELVKIGTYQDRIYKEEGKWYIEKQIGKVVLDGTENWALASMFYCTSPLQSIAECVTPSGGNVVSDYFTWSSGAQNNHTIDIVGAYIIRIRDTNFADVSALTTWLSTHPTTVYYPLATPTTTEITNQALVSQLEAILQAYLYTGINNITSSTYLPSNFEIKFFTEYTRDTDVVVIDSQLKTVTLNGMDIYHLLSDSSEFIDIAPGDNEMVLTSTNQSDEGTATIKFKQGYLSI